MLFHQLKLFILQLKRSYSGSKEGSTCDDWQQCSAHNGGGWLDGWDADTWRCFLTSLSHWSRKWDDQWAMAALELWIFGFTQVKPAGQWFLSWSTWALKRAWMTCRCWEHSGRGLLDARVTGENRLMTSQTQQLQNKNTPWKKPEADSLGCRPFTLYCKGSSFYGQILPLQTARRWRNSSF